MKSLLLIAHGSRLETSNLEIRQLADKLRAKAGDHFSRVSAAFLEIARPSIPEAIDGIIKEGTTEIIVLPCFLAAGKHIVRDIPAALEEKRGQYPQVAIRLAPYLGTADEALTDLLFALCQEPLP